MPSSLEDRHESRKAYRCAKALEAKNGRPVRGGQSFAPWG